MSHDAYPFVADETRNALRIRRRVNAELLCAIQLDGELDLQTAVSLRAEISAALDERPAPARIDVDLAGVTFVDSLGLGTLIVGHRICAQMGVQFTVGGPSPFVARLLEISGFPDHLVDPA